MKSMAINRPAMGKGEVTETLALSGQRLKHPAEQCVVTSSVTEIDRTSAYNKEWL